MVLQDQNIIMEMKGDIELEMQVLEVELAGTEYEDWDKEKS